jgi:hypothetical protein
LAIYRRLELSMIKRIQIMEIWRKYYLPLSIILKDFLGSHPHAEILFTGSTEERTKLYGRIIKMHHLNFAKDFMVSGFTQKESGYEEQPLNPLMINTYVAFFNS